MVLRTVDERITVVTASMPGREWELTQACASVSAQTVAPAAHLIRVARPPEAYGPSPLGIALQRNALAAGCGTEWILNLDDDDRLLPDYIERIGERLAHADVVYAWDACKTVPTARVDVTTWDQDRLVAQLEEQNIISSCAAVRLESLMDVGGYPTRFSMNSGKFKGTPCTWEDWALWLALAKAGARFVCVPEELWEYRWDVARSSQTIWNNRRKQVMGVLA